MKRIVVVLMCLCLATSMPSFAAEIIVYENDYESQTVGNDFPAWDWCDNGIGTHVSTYEDYGSIVVKHVGTINNTTSAAVNTRFGSKWDITMSGNTSSDPADYTIEFDLHSISGNWDPIAIEFFVLTTGGTQGRGSGASNYAFADGVVHVSKKLSELTVGWWQGTSWNLTSSTWSIEVGGPPWPGVAVQPGESFTQIWLMDNLKITEILAETKSSNPDPPNGAVRVNLDAIFSWTPGKYADKHDIYLGTVYNDVNNATRGTPLNVLVKQDNGPNNYDPGVLQATTTYYWRIDDVNDPNIYKGSVWSFTTSRENLAEMIVYENDYEGETPGNGFPAWNWGDGVTTHIAVFADYNDNIVVEHTGRIDNSGGTEAANCRFGSKWDITLSGNKSTDPADYTISFDLRSVSGNWDPIALELSVLTYNPAQGTGTYGYGSGPSNYAQATGWVHVTANLADLTVGWWEGTNWDLTNSTWSIEVGGPPWPGTSVPAGTPAWDQVWIMDNLKITALVPATSTDPYPQNGATDVELTPTLSWTPGVNADKHDVYFSNNWDDVNDANSSDPCGPSYVYKGRIDPCQYDITAPLTWGQTYYWRIDEVNGTNIWRGNIWNFTTRNFLPVDNFESYTNFSPNKIRETWKNSGGGTVGYNDQNYVELTIVHNPGTNSRQSMPFDYNNTSFTDSNATRTFAQPQNWTTDPCNVYSLKSLGLWFRGYPAPVGSFTRSGSPPYYYTMTASGEDINVPNWRFSSKWRDEFHYAYTPITGNCDIIAKVESVSNTDAEAKAGIMIRDSLADNSTYAMMCITPSSGIRFQYRATADGITYTDTNSVPRAPYWLWLERYYSSTILDYVFTAWYSPTGLPGTWVPLGEVDTTAVPVTNPIYIGLAVTARNAAATCTAVFSNVSITQGGTVEPDPGNRTKPGGDDGAGYPERGTPVTPSPWTSHQDIGIKSNTAALLSVTLQEDASVGGDTATVTHPDPNIVLQNTWQEWNIALSEFKNKTPSLDLTKIKKITIGVDSQSAPVGTLYFDDIRLYIPRCIPGILPDSADSSCVVNYPDLQILTNNWLVSNYQVTPAAPSDANLVAYYNFNGNFNDSKGHNGEPNGAFIINDPVRGQVANFDGINDYVSLPIGPDINSMNSTTIATWVNFSNASGSFQRIFDFGNNTTVYMFLTPRTGTTGPMRFAITTTSAGGESQLTAPSTLATGWHHVAVVINGVSKTMQLYLDGIVVASGPTQTLPRNLGVTTNNWLGRSQWTGDAYFIGYLDDFRIYNRALSLGEVASLAGKTTTFTQPLYLLLTPQNSGINLYNDGRIDLKDYAVLADAWLEILLWP